MIFSALRRRAACNKPKRVPSAREFPFPPQRLGTHLHQASEDGKFVYAAALALRAGRLRPDLRTPPACFAYFATLHQGFRLLTSVSWLYQGQGNPWSSFVHRPYCVRSSFARRPFILHSSFSRPPSNEALSKQNFPKVIKPPENFVVNII